MWLERGNHVHGCAGQSDSKDSRDAWGPLAPFRDLPQALHVALLRSAEKLAIKLRADLATFATIEVRALH